MSAILFYLWIPTYFTTDLPKTTPVVYPIYDFPKIWASKQHGSTWFCCWNFQDIMLGVIPDGWKNWALSTPFQTDGKSKPIYRAGTLRRSPTGKHARCLSAWRLRSMSMKEEYLLKPPLGNMPTMSVITGNIREENPPLQTTPRKSSLVSARKSCRPYERSDDRWKTCLLHGPAHST